GSRRRIPRVLLPPRRPLGDRFSFAITTFEARYETYFRPLYRSLRRSFPEVPILVAVNGHGDQASQSRYLERICRELASGEPPHRRFLLHDRVVGLCQLWNELLQASPTATTLVLNDDLRIDPYLRRWAEAMAWDTVDLTLLNNTWSHFAIGRHCWQQVGAFDQSFSGIGFEDMDYTARASLAGVRIVGTDCPYLHHANDQPTTTSFDGQSERVWGKYTSANQEVFVRKWERCPEPEGTYIRQLGHHVRPIAPLPPLPVPPLNPSGPGIVHLDRTP
ncbi:glycosyltransferase family 2 protein, partial [Cyanobium sp. N5-Cardenillas]|uniref:glycosyltransferase family 2 protein n=1 Tax=Cyanobium sp. N5-Cardenillas TaxID=2823720 RepID=UPI0020CBAF1F